MKTGDVGHTFEFGGRLLRESAHYQDRQGDYPESFSGAAQSEEKHTGLAVAGYLQDRIALRDDLLITPGVRFEHLTVKRTILRRQNGTTSEDVFLEGGDDVNGVIPGVGAIYGTKKAHAFGGLHLGFAPPRFASSVSVAGVPQGVKAEKSLNYELGTRVAPIPWLRSELTGFLSTYSNQVIANTSAEATDATALSDAGATTIYGLETGTTAMLAKLAKADAVVDVGVRYTYSRATFRYGRNAGNLLPYAPEHSFNANADVELRSGWGGQLAYRYVGPQFSDEANTVPEDVTGRIGRIDGYGVADATRSLPSSPERAHVPAHGEEPLRQRLHRRAAARGHLHRRLPAVPVRHPVGLRSASRGAALEPARAVRLRTRDGGRPRIRLGSRTARGRRKCAARAGATPPPSNGRTTKRAGFAQRGSPAPRASQYGPRKTCTSPLVTRALCLGTRRAVENVHDPNVAPRYRARGIVRPGRLLRRRRQAER